MLSNSLLFPSYKQKFDYSKQQKFGLAQIETICRQQNKCDSNIKVCYGMSWLAAFSSFLTMFSKSFLFLELLKVVKSQDYAVRN